MNQPLIISLSSTSLSLLMLLKFFYDFILFSSISTCICSLTASPPLLHIATTSLASLLLFFVVNADIVTSTLTDRHFPLLRHRHHFHHHPLSLHFNHHPSSLPTSSTSSLHHPLSLLQNHLRQ